MAVDDWVSNQDRSIMRNVRVGDFIELAINGTFFNRSDGGQEKYGGYVHQIGTHSMHLATTAPMNVSHGYDGKSQALRSPHLTEITFAQIMHYRIA